MTDLGHRTAFTTIFLLITLTIIKASKAELSSKPANHTSRWSTLVGQLRPCTSDAQCSSTVAGSACHQASASCRCKFGHVFGGLNDSHCEPMACASDQDCAEAARILWGSPTAGGKTSCDEEAWQCRCAPGYSYWTNSFSCDVDLGTVVLWIALAIGVVIVLLAVVLFLFLCICYSFKKTVEGVGRRLSNGTGKGKDKKNKRTAAVAEKGKGSFGKVDKADKADKVAGGGGGENSKAARNSSAASYSSSSAAAKEVQR